MLVIFGLISWVFILSGLFLFVHFVSVVAHFLFWFDPHTFCCLNNILFCSVINLSFILRRLASARVFDCSLGWKIFTVSISIKINQGEMIILCMLVIMDLKQILVSLERLYVVIQSDGE